MTSATTSDRVLLNDEQLVDFIINGYTIVETDLGDEFNRGVFDQLEALPENPGDGILEAIPALNDVYSHPKVAGTLASILGSDYYMYQHRHCHRNMPGTPSQMWHLDGGAGTTERSPDHVQAVLAMYYPQDVESNMGPTALIPGTHLFPSSTDRMASYGNFKNQVIATVNAGSVLIVHYDVWHAGTANSSDNVRYMIKFLFNRASESTKPSWDYDPAAAAAQAPRLQLGKGAPVTRALAGLEKNRRIAMWNNLAGDVDFPDEYWDQWKGPWPGH
ncbi:MAG: phytanoyl-CoA dioxygenase family protein [Chloroflexi bacterium]|nr:phytanoyl-CoA dioxygenase family protein [Chloroflexota bacterium]